MKKIKKFPVFNNNWNLIKIANCKKKLICDNVDWEC